MVLTEKCLVLTNQRLCWANLETGAYLPPGPCNTVFSGLDYSLLASSKQRVCLASPPPGGSPNRTPVQVGLRRGNERCTPPDNWLRSQFGV
jgi:hypothetical protein